jgi:acetyl esterase/lipase
VRRAAGDAAQGYVRSHASEYHLFSAGGHLAAQTATHFDAGNPAAQDTIERASSRPDFAILSCPVIGPLGGRAKWNFENILDQEPSAKQIEELSPDLHVTGETPTTFIMQSDDDETVSAMNSIHSYAALKAAGVPAELQVYRTGGQVADWRRWMWFSPRTRCEWLIG